ncbi:MAG: hypothetical protein HKN09_09330 [Saprospiraceae bacterium]|nr:hypothetical protein [Saprospiraceae bacterium]
MRCDVQYFSRCTIIALIVLFSSASYGQFNVRVGFNQTFVSADALDLIIENYNQANATVLEKEMGFLNSMQGINIGVDYKIGNRLLMVHWNNFSKQHAAIGELTDGSLLEEELFYTTNQFLFAVENRFNNIGIGTGMAYNQWRIKNRIASSDFKRTLVSDSQWSAHIHLAFNFTSSARVGFSIIPFIQIPLSDIGLGPVNSELNNNSQGPQEDFNLWGIQFVFINGQQ